MDIAYLCGMATKTLPVKDTNILIRIDPKLKARAFKAATKEGQKLSEFIRKTLEEKISQVLA